MARNQFDRYVSDIGGLPNWNQYVAGYDQGNVLSGRTSGSMYEGKAPEFSDTKAARMPAFFEHSNVNLPQYA